MPGHTASTGTCRKKPFPGSANGWAEAARTNSRNHDTRSLQQQRLLKGAKPAICPPSGAENSVEQGNFNYIAALAKSKSNVFARSLKLSFMKAALIMQHKCCIFPVG